jgi:hypothetical protein
LWGYLQGVLLPCSVYWCCWFPTPYLLQLAARLHVVSQNWFWLLAANWHAIVAAYRLYIWPVTWPICIAWPLFQLVHECNASPDDPRTRHEQTAHHAVIPIPRARAASIRYSNSMCALPAYIGGGDRPVSVQLKWSA